MRREVVNVCFLKLEDAVELERRVQETFSRFPQPGAKELAPGDHSPEGRELRADFAGKRWSEITYENLMYWRSDLSCFSPRQWVYYLPAFLVVSLRTRCAELAMSVITALTPRADDSSLEFFNERLALLDQAQREVLRDYVLLIWPLYYDELNAEDDPRGFWNDLVTMPGGRAIKPPEGKSELGD